MPKGLFCSHPGVRVESKQIHNQIDLCQSTRTESFLQTSHLTPTAETEVSKHELGTLRRETVDFLCRWHTDTLEDKLQLVDSAFAAKERRTKDQLCKDTTCTPHINRFTASSNTQQSFRWPVPSRCHVLRQNPLADTLPLDLQPRHSKVANLKF